MAGDPGLLRVVSLAAGMLISLLQGAVLRDLSSGLYVLMMGLAPFLFSLLLTGVTADLHRFTRCSTLPRFRQGHQAGGRQDLSTLVSSWPGTRKREVSMFGSYFWIISIVVEIVFIVHAINRRQDYFWIFIILFFPMVGCAVYALMVWIPEARHSRTARGTSKAMLALLDPKRELRKRLSHLDVSDTVANRVSLAGELTRHGMVQDALALYERSLKGVYEDDPYLLQGYAGALFEAGMWQDARATLEKLRATNPSLKAPDAQLLYARVLEKLGEVPRADKEYAAVVRAYGAMEAKCRYGMFLKQQARNDEAKELFEDILRGAKHTSGHSRRLNKEWIGTAKRELA